MSLSVVESIARWLGAVAIVIAWVAAVRGATVAHGLPQGAASGLAARVGTVPAYLVTAVPYFGVCVVLWHPLPITLSTELRVLALVLGLELGLAGVAWYVWAHSALGEMYQVTGTLGASVFENHRLVASGPYALIRHPMYFGIAVGAVGGLLLYRTWTFVFILGMLPGVVLRAHREERLLAAALGEDYLSYRRVVPGWWPRPGCVGRALSASGAGSGPLAPNLGIVGRVVRGLIVPGAGVLALTPGLPGMVRIAAAVIGVSSLVSALSGHCFLCDLRRLLRPGSVGSRAR